MTHEAHATSPVTPTSTIKWRAHLHALVIGGSAGAIEALNMLLPALPAHLSIPVFVVLHLPRERPSLLVEIFAPKCAVPIVEAFDKQPIVPGTVYFAPPDYHLLVDEGPTLALSVDDPVYYSRPSIDVLFESAADMYGAHLVGILLTGGNEDGAHGLQAIGHAGGVTVVQDPADAQIAVMPMSALNLGPVDFILPLSHIADMLHALPTQPPDSPNTERQI